MEKKRLVGIAKGVGRDLLMAMIVVVIVMLVLYAYCGIWPPMVVVESGSMQHSDDRSYIGVIDTGDMVFVKEIGNYDLKSYVDGEATGYSTYGGFGDVVIYRPNGDESRTPIIHRLVVWVEPNATLAMPPIDGRVDYNNYTFDIPSLGIYGSVDDVVIHEYGHKSRDVTISLIGFRDEYLANSIPHSGYITMGDNNVPMCDQPGYELVKPEWVVGKAIGELPWFGLIKLSVTKPTSVGAPMNSWVNLFILIFLVLFIPLFFDFGLPFLKKKYGGRKAGKKPTPENTVLEREAEKNWAPVNAAAGRVEAPIRKGGPPPDGVPDEGETDKVVEEDGSKPPGPD